MGQLVIGKFRLGDKVCFKDECRKLRHGEIVLVGLNGYVVAFDGCVAIKNECELEYSEKGKVEAEANEAKIKVGDIIDTPKGKGTVRIAVGGSYSVQLDNGDWYVHMEETISSPNKESKEPKFKVGDMVRVCDPNLSCFGFVGSITKVEDGLIFATDGYGIDFTAKESCLERVQSKEQTEAEEDACIRQMEAVFYEGIKEELEHILHHEKPTFEVTIDNLSMDWQRYEADLAKEVALKVANKFNAPYEAAEYAVLVANAVVEGLKRK